MSALTLTPKPASRPSVVYNYVGIGVQLQSEWVYNNRRKMQELLVYRSLSFTTLRHTLKT
jgi:hypothetical protein